jgi:hypothetical protein
MRTTANLKNPKKPRKQPPSQNLENKEPTKILPAKETKQHPKHQENLRTAHKKTLKATNPTTYWPCLSYTSKKL